MASTTSNNLPEPIASVFPGLNLRQYRLLCFIAYHGSRAHSIWAKEKYDGLFGVPKGRSSQDVKKLVEEGYLVKEKLPTEQISPSWFFKAIVPMFTHFPQWEDKFKSCSGVRDDYARWLWQVAWCISCGDLEPAKRLPYPRMTERIWRFFAPVVFSKEYGPVLSVLSEEDRETLLFEILESSLAFDHTADNLTTRVINLARSFLLHPEATVSHAMALKYFSSGDRPVGRPAGNCWSLAVDGIAHLYRNELSEALESFLEALKYTNSYGSRNKVFPSPVLNWFYAICLVRCCKKLHSHKARVALDSLQSDSAFKFKDINGPTRILLTYLDSTDRKCPEYVAGELDKISKDARTVTGAYLGYLVAKYYRVPEERIQTLWVNTPGTPATSIFRHEMSACVPMTSSEKESLKDIFGGPASLTTLPRKEGWEMSLSELTEVVRENKDEKDVQKRIIYFLVDNWISAILEQSRESEDEEWGHDRLLSRSTFTKGGYDSMDVTDLKLASALGRKIIDTPDRDVVVPILAGTGRLFTGQHYRQPYLPLHIEEEAPFIAFSGKDGCIEVSSNVNRLPDGSIPATQTLARDGGYVCVRTNPVQRDILEKLLAVGRFPASAAPAIRNTIESLKGIIDVRASLGNAAVIPTMRGSVRMALRISPDKESNDYVLDVNAAPYEDGALRCEPGQGAEDVYDDTGDSPHFIKRDLQQEFDNYSEFRDFAEKEVNLEFSTPTRADIGCSESLLKILVWAYDHRDKCFVEWPEGRPLRFRGDVKSGDFDITVSSGIDWFAVEGDVNIGRDKYNLRDILEAMKASDVDGFIKLGDKDYIRMSKAIQKHLAALDEMMNQKVGKDRVVPVYRVGQLAQVLGEEGGLHGTMDEGFKDLLGRMQNAYDTVPELPEGLNATLRDYQKEGYIWMKRLDAWGAGACLADDMGLGKTLQSLAFILSKASEGPSLVVAPKSIIPNWDIEAAKFTPSLRVIVLNNENKRQDVINAAGPNDLVLATYGVLGTEAKALASREWNVVCLDEAHQIKNRNTRISAAAMGLQARSRLILTGTPIQNHLGELWNLFQFINPGLLGQWSEFKSRYMGTAALDDENKSFLKDLVQPFILRRTKEEVLDDLPEKIVYEQMVELSPEELQVYEATRKYVEDRMNDPGKKGKSKTSDDHVPIQFFAELTKLRLAACSMSLVYDDWKGSSSKTEALKGILEELSGSEGNRVLIFSQFTSYLAQIRAMLDKAGMRYLYLDGQTELDERAELVEQFQNGDCPIFLVSLKAGGLGLNLTAANYVILLDPWWNPAIENQAMDRAHRIGQKRNVTVIRLISQHTIEEKILHLHEKKQTLTDEMLDGTADSYHLTMDDVLDMVSPFR